MRTLKLTLAYDGTAFHGWQTQLNRRTVQQTLSEVLEKITGRRVSAHASGRTDAGVHALGQVVSFDTDTTLDTATLQRALDAELPDDIIVLAVEEAPVGFHARRHAVRKRYRYVIQDGPRADVFRRHYAWRVYRRLDDRAMLRASQPLVGMHNFATFESRGSKRSNSVRTIFELTVARPTTELLTSPNPPGDEIHIEICADGFLYNMVRNIVGMLVDIGRGAADETWPTRALAAVDRRAAGPPAPSRGLVLVSVDYGGGGLTNDEARMSKE
ncbi:MAG TPA: tRNA pseudouridine(38-40) synthase TruA [Pirellulales bacterium]|jgi:tRNA pseudouridine38-40 synthase|nr:tRNA pseudouridine(38-40) synthase TruA [Pirellulales bacterium]